MRCTRNTWTLRRYLTPPLHFLSLNFIAQRPHYTHIHVPISPCIPLASICITIHSLLTLDTGSWLDPSDHGYAPAFGARLTLRVRVDDMVTCIFTTSVMTTTLHRDGVTNNPFPFPIPSIPPLSGCIAELTCSMRSPFSFRYPLRLVRMLDHSSTSTTFCLGDWIWRMALSGVG